MSAPHALCNRPLGTHVFRPDVRYGNVESDTCTQTKVPHITVTYGPQAFTGTDSFIFADFTRQATTRVTSGQIRLSTANAVYISVPGLYAVGYDTTLGSITQDVRSAVLINSSVSNIVYALQSTNASREVTNHSLSSAAIVNVNAGQTITLGLAGTGTALASGNFFQTKMEVHKVN